MLMNIPIKYKSSGRKAGKAIDSNVIFAEVVRIEVHDTTDEDTPICAQWDDTPPAEAYNDGQWEVASGAEIQHVRYYAGHYYRPLDILHIKQEIENTKQLERVTPFELYTSLSDGLLNSDAIPECLNGYTLRRDDEYFETLKYSDRNEAIQDAKKIVNDILIVDGELYRRCLEPMIVAQTSSFRVETDDRTMTLSTMGKHLRIVTEMPHPSKTKIINLFPLHNYKEALSHTRRGNSGIKEYLNEINSEKKPELFSEYFNDPNNACISECRIKLHYFLTTLEAQRYTKLPFSDRDKNRMVLDLADALDALPSNQAFDTIETLGREYLERYGHARRWSLPENVFLREAIEAAEARPIVIPSNSEAFRV